MATQARARASRDTPRPTPARPAPPAQHAALAPPSAPTPLALALGPAAPSQLTACPLPVAAKSKLLKPAETVEKQRERESHAAANAEAEALGEQAKADFVSNNATVQREALQKLCNELLNGAKGYYTKQRVLMIILGECARPVAVMKLRLVTRYAPQLKALRMWVPEWDP